MLIQPNETVILARVLEVAAALDGIGFAVSARVDENRSAQSADFIRPTSGQLLDLYSADPLQAESEYLLRVTLLAGPFGERRAICSAEPVAR